MCQLNTASTAMKDDVVAQKTIWYRGVNICKTPHEEYEKCRATFYVKLPPTGIMHP